MPCEKEKRAQLSTVSTEFEKEIDARIKAETKAKDAAVENERLRAEKAQLEAQVKDCKPPVPETKKVVPRKKKPRAAKPKTCEKKVVSRPEEKALVPPKAVAPTTPPTQEETLEQKLSKACGGPVKFDEARGKWKCDKQEERKVQSEPALPADIAPADDFFANAVDEGVEAQAQAQTSTYVAPVYVEYDSLSRANCMTQPFRDPVDGRFYPIGAQHDRRNNGTCRCGSPGCYSFWQR